MLHENRTFLSAFLRSPQVVASVVPSSSFVERRVVRAADVARANFVVELGGGVGGITRALLQALGPRSRLLVIERTARFVEVLNRIDDRRLSVVHGCASSIGEELLHCNYPAADAVISGIPFSTMSTELGTAIVSAVHEALAPGGRFVAYQLSDRIASYARPRLGKPTVEFELRNVPPLRIFTWRKSGNPGQANGD